jgi:hypothetical protein
MQPPRAPGTATKDLMIAAGLALAGFSITVGASLRALRGDETGGAVRHSQLPQRLSRAESADAQALPTRDANVPRASEVAVSSARTITPVTASEPATPDAVVESPAVPGPLTDEEIASRRNTPVPVMVLIHKTPGESVEVSLRNTSQRTEEVGVTLTDARNAARAELEFAAQPQSTRTLGVDEGWQLESGDEITVTSAPYRPRTVRVP